MVTKKPIKAIVYVTTGVIADAYLNKLRIVATKLQIRLFVYEKGFLSDTFVKDWSNMMKSKSSELTQSNNENENDDDDGNDDDDDDDNNDDDDGDNNDDEHNRNLKETGERKNDDECETFLKKMIQSNRSKGPNLYKKPKIKPAKNPRKYFDLTKYDQMEDNDHTNFSGGGVLTRSAKKRKLDQGGEEEERIEKEKERKKRKNENTTVGQTTATENVENDRENEKDIPDEMTMERTTKDPLVSIERSGCLFDKYTVIVADDLLCSKTNLKDEKTMKTNYIKNVCFLESLATRDCHRFSLHLVVTTQSSIGGTGNSMSNQSLRNLRANVDGMVLFPAPSRDIRAIISSLFTGDHYQTVKSIYKTQIEQSNFFETPSDDRHFRPYFFFLINMLSNKRYRYR